MKIADLDTLVSVDEMNVTGGGSTSTSAHTTAGPGGATAQAGAKANGPHSSTSTTTKTSATGNPYYQQNMAHAQATAQSSKDRSHADDRSIYFNGRWG